MKDPVKLIILGMGNRSSIYAYESIRHPEQMQIVGVVDINPVRVKQAKELYKIPEEHCFSSVDELVAVPKFADAVINATMDQQHVETSIPLLEHGYDLLLEKPFAVNQEEADRLLACAHRTGRRVMVCHVLRYAPFYRRIKEVLEAGTIGEIINIQMAEQVSFFHQSVSYVRGKYADPEACGSGMLLSKSSHDMDILAWLMRGNRPVSVSSTGNIFQYKPEKAPAGAGRYCLLDCKIERECPYSARRLYLENPQRWANNVWHDSGYETLSEENKQRLMGDPNNRFARCVYSSDNRIVDHQSVLVTFENGATGTFSMNGGAAASGRHIHITGTKGEIMGTFEKESFTIDLIAPTAPGGYTVEVVDVSGEQLGNPHGMGDQILMQDFVKVLRGEAPSISCTTLDDSMVGHKLVFLAEESRVQGGQMQRY